LFVFSVHNCIEYFKHHKYPTPDSFPILNNEYFHFEIVSESTKSRARVGRIHTPHGIIDTPAFVPVATTGTLKYLSTLQSQQFDIQLIFCNTYHFLIHPGMELIEQMNGIHQFIHHHKPIITDSGGFQVYSYSLFRHSYRQT
jgi:queuine tRNA-ribosyltransferase